VGQRWPADWEQRLRGEGCPMCAAGRPDQDESGIRIYASDTADAYLQLADVGQRGYTIVIWRGRHVAEPTELTPDEAGAYWDDVLRVMRALELHYRPAKLNLFTLGNSVPHLHTHVVPRYVDDGAPGVPPLFMRGQAPRGALPEAEARAEAAALRQRIDSQISA